METHCLEREEVNRGVSEESVIGAGVIKSINCLEKEMEGELVQSAAATLVFVTGFNLKRVCTAWSKLEDQRCRGRGNEVCRSPWYNSDWQKV